MAERVLVTEPIVEEPLNRLRERCQVEVARRGTFDTEEQLVQAVELYDAVLCMLSTPMTENVLEAGRNLKIVANYAVGYDNIDVEAARKHGIHVSNTPDVLTEATADLAWTLLLGVARKINPAQRHLREGKFYGWEPTGFLGTELHGRTMGIIGMGRIGQAAARRARGFGMDVIYHNRNRVDESVEQDLGATYINSVEELVEQADILSLHCPLTDDTRQLIDDDMFHRMPSHAILINTARGPVVDEAALAKALHEERIGGAGLDVYENEPSVHTDLLTAPNCVMLPHIGSATTETRRKMGDLAVDAIIGILDGKDPSNIPNIVTA